MSKFFEVILNFLLLRTCFRSLTHITSKGGVPEISHCKMTSEPLRAPTGEGFWVKTGGAMWGEGEKDK